MDNVVHEGVVSLVGTDGRTYTLFRVHADERRDGTWAAWIEFTTADGKRVVTDRETTQPSKQAVAYWATGLEPVYLEGALGRALDLLLKA